VSDSLLGRLPAEWQGILEGEWTFFVERWMADDRGRNRRLARWRRDRVAACAYHWLGEPMRAARHLRASLVTHYCGGGSCWFAPAALQFLYLEAREPFKAGLTSRSFNGQRGPAFGPPFGDFPTTAHLRRLVAELVALHRDAPADPEIESLITQLGHEAADVRARALRALERLGPVSSPAMFAAARSSAPDTRQQIDAVLGDWALTHAAERLFPPGPPDP
jgi:hypothetical protein